MTQRDQFTDWCRDAGIHCYIDSAGSVRYGEVVIKFTATGRLDDIIADCDCDDKY